MQPKGRATPEAPLLPLLGASTLTAPTSHITQALTIPEPSTCIVCVPQSVLLCLFSGSKVPGFQKAIHRVTGFFLPVSIGTLSLPAFLVFLNRFIPYDLPDVVYLCHHLTVTHFYY